MTITFIYPHFQLWFFCMAGDDPTKEHHDPSLYLAFDIANNLGVTVDQLFLYEGQEEK
ncbi:hypothetical protein ACIGHG_23950 [Bacillus sp. NPDC077411]